MSRSFKHTPIIKCAGDRSNKKLANRVVRRAEGLYQGKTYRKLFQSWNIYDYISRYTKDEALKDMSKLDKYCTYYSSCTDEKECINKWEKAYYRK